MQILKRFKLITTFIFDMDGVLTDGNILIDKDNNWLRSMNVRDGYALQLAVKSGYRVVVISGSNSGPVTERLKRLGIKEVFMNVTSKADFLKEYMKINNLHSEEVLFMGDDIPDYFCMKMAGISACPSDAALEIRDAASYISNCRGGDGCARDVVEKVLKLNGHWQLENNIPST
ncbi:MAG TPA: HAD hydrolase-like protein [Hanamia sp.]|jgi:3-deoxy-D-manno-octulosonate 8-phosphate phosphatase (KDO 8-P phosphatase)|nr:HAD hydrolase-like protein [Hanamia sp.]